MKSYLRLGKACIDKEGAIINYQPCRAPVVTRAPLKDDIEVKGPVGLLAQWLYEFGAACNCDFVVSECFRFDIRFVPC